MHDFNGNVLSRTYITMGEIEYYNWSTVREQILYCLERYFEAQRKAKNPLFMGNKPMDKEWEWEMIQLDGMEFLFTDKYRVANAHTVKYMRQCVVKSMQVLTPPK